MRAPLRVAGLFAGIGGVELGLRRAGHEAELVCEIEPGARAVLKARLPDVRLHDDVRTLKKIPAGVDLLTGGFPCQDLSQAGKTVGIGGERSGLVGEVFRLIESRRVPWVMLENVPFMLQLGRGKAMDVLATAFERLGYRWAYRVVTSQAFGLPQRRHRVIFLASLEHDPREVLFGDDAGEPEIPESPLGRLACGFYWTEGIRGLGWAVDAVPTLKGGSTIGIPSSPGIVMPSGEIVTPDIRDAERMQGFEPGWTTPSREVAREGHRWKLVGNAVTVDVFAWVGRRLREPVPVDPAANVWPLRRSSPWPRAAWNVGDGRFGIELSMFPVNVERRPLHEWLEYDTVPLSLRATAGFLSRTDVSSLNFPDGFLELMRAHQKRMERYPMPPKAPRGLRVREAATAPLGEWPRLGSSLTVRRLREWLACGRKARHPSWPCAAP